MNIDQLQTIVFNSTSGELKLPEADLHIVPVSSGVDSTAVALVLKAYFPNQKFLYVFTDTGVETSGTYEALDRLEETLGAKIERVTGKFDLFDIIESMGTFLPSGKQRYCTRMSKIIPYEAFMLKLRSEMGNVSIASYVGIRADEAHRTGAEFDPKSGITSYFPLQSLGMDKQAVMSLVDKVVGIPHYYVSKSRSGCGVCIFSRRSEIISQIDNDPKLAYKASQLESLSDSAKKTLLDLPESIEDRTGITRNHLSFPIPSHVAKFSSLPFETERGTKANFSNGEKVIDMFSSGSRTIYCAVEFERFWDGFEHQIAFQRFVTYSNTLGGLKRSLKFYWEHRLNTRQMMGCDSEEKLREDFKVALFQVSIDNYDDLFSIDMDGAYTWQTDGQPILLIRKMSYIIQQILLAGGLTQMAADGADWASEALSKSDKLGEVLWSGAFEAPTAEDLADDIDIEDAPIPCVQCSR